MKGPSCSLNRAKEGGYILGFMLSGRGGEGEEVSHLLFANDLLIFCEANEDQIVYLSLKQANSNGQYSYR